LAQACRVVQAMLFNDYSKLESRQIIITHLLCVGFFLGQLKYFSQKENSVSLILK
jgi:hypothetical protein